MDFEFDSEEGNNTNPFQNIHDMNPHIPKNKNPNPNTNPIAQIPPNTATNIFQDFAHTPDHSSDDDDDDDDMSGRTYNGSASSGSSGSDHPSDYSTANSKISPGNWSNSQIPGAATNNTNLFDNKLSPINNNSPIFSLST
jgi:hypothetical protein